MDAVIGALGRCWLEKVLEAVGYGVLDIQLGLSITLGTDNYYLTQRVDVWLTLGTNISYFCCPTEYGVDKLASVPPTSSSQRNQSPPQNSAQGTE